MNGLRVRLLRFLLDPRVALSVPLLVAAGAAVQQVLLTRYRPLPDGLTHYNNFLVFRQAFVHLLEGRNLYLDFPGEHFDNFLYSPTFAVLMAPFSVLPVAPSLVLWNLANAAVMVAGIRSVPGLDGRARSLFAWFLLLEFVGAAQNSQTNPAIVGLLLLAFAAAERRRASAAGLLLALAGYVKIFPLAAGLVFLLYPWRLRLVLSTAAWVLALALLPLLVVSPAALLWQYGNWIHLHTTSTHAAGLGMSVAQLLHAWFGVDPPRVLLLGVAGIATALPLLRPARFGDPAFRAAFLGALLMWMIAFNHLTESPTFVIAMAGIALWYFGQASTPLHRGLLWAALLLVSVTYSDLVPPGFRNRFLHPYGVKVLPVAVIWVVAVVELTTGDRGRREPAPAAPTA
ncbi:MAG: glycosyltransferase family 87 protein [Anaeromyxobacteraceae bacterium]